MLNSFSALSTWYWRRPSTEVVTALQCIFRVIPEKKFATMLLSEFTRMHCSEAASQLYLRRRHHQGALLKPTPVEGRRCALLGGALFGRVEEEWSSRDPFANTGVSGTRVVLRCWRAFIKSTDVLDNDRFVTIIYGWREGCLERASLFACLLAYLCQHRWVSTCAIVLRCLCWIVITTSVVVA